MLAVERVEPRLVVPVYVESVSEGARGFVEQRVQFLVVTCEGVMEEGDEGFGVVETQTDAYHVGEVEQGTDQPEVEL